MKGLFFRLSLLAAIVLFFSVPVRSHEGMDSGGYNMGVSGTKDECLLVAKDCSTETIQERIGRIEHEIKRGTDVYTRDELKEMERQLDFYKNDIQYLDRDRG